jgi:hypothetical protein
VSKKKTPLQGLPRGGSKPDELLSAIAVHTARREGCLAEQERLRKELWAILADEKLSHRLLTLQEQMEEQGQWAAILERKQRDLERAYWRIQNAGRTLPVEMEEGDDERRTSAG